MKMKDLEHGCQNCIWIDRENLCPFQRCVRKNGWLADKKKGERA